MDGHVLFSLSHLSVVCPVRLLVRRRTPVDVVCSQSLELEGVYSRWFEGKLQPWWCSASVSSMS